MSSPTKILEHAMRLRCAFVSLLFVVSACALGAEDSEDSANLVSRLLSADPGDVMIVAHRTCWRTTAENSLEGLERCIELGIDMVEVDVRRTADGVLVLMHDETIDRTTTGTGSVNSITFAELRELYLRESDGVLSNGITTYRVPTLKELLRSAKDRILVNLDVKDPVQEQVLDLIEDLGVGDQALLKSYSRPNEEELSSRDFYSRAHFMPIVVECPNRYGPNCTDDLGELVPLYRPYRPIAYELVNSTDEFLHESAIVVESEGLRLWVNTLGPRFAAGRSDDKSLIDPDANWGYVIDAGVNMIQTDRPEELLIYLKSREERQD